MPTSCSLWNIHRTPVFAARIIAGSPNSASASATSSSGKGLVPVPGFIRTVPILRSFDEAKAREFYLGFLGFGVDWEHRFEPDAPLYMQVSRDGIIFHISEHHGDGSPGVHVRV